MQIQRIEFWSTVCVSELEVDLPAVKRRTLDGLSPIVPVLLAPIANQLGDSDADTWDAYEWKQPDAAVVAFSSIPPFLPLPGD